jgi:hypothetical protein
VRVEKSKKMAFLEGKIEFLDGEMTFFEKKVKTPAFFFGQVLGLGYTGPRR